ncbi:MAG: hypothetical protein OES90_07740, partial [Xanthomonadales bacterium]|nr:hypothetical protein [Xanthomonadales bacterium]
KAAKAGPGNVITASMRKMLRNTNFTLNSKIKRRVCDNNNRLVVRKSQVLIKPANGGLHKFSLAIACKTI